MSPRQSRHNGTVDLSAVIAELNDIAARLGADPDPGERARLEDRRKTLNDRARAFDVQVRRAEYERELRQVEARIAGVNDLEVDHRNPRRGFLRGALWGDYDFPKDAEELNRKMGEAMDRPRLEARAGELRTLLGLEPSGD